VFFSALSILEDIEKQVVRLMMHDEKGVSS
jgi:hypothetical protein